MPYITTIAECHSLFKHGGLGAKNKFDSPLHSIDPIDVSNRNGGTAVCMFPESEIYRRHGNPIVRDGKIEFDPERRPRTAITNVSFLDRRIGVEHRLAGDFVYAGIKVSADIGKYRTFQALIFKIDGAPVMVHPAIRQVVSQGIRIVEAGAGELIERRIWVRQSFFVGGQRKCILPDSYLRPSCRCASDQQNRKQVVDSHQVAIRRCRAAFS